MLSFLLPILKSKLAALGVVLVIALIIVIWGPRFVGHRWWCYGFALLLVLGFLLYLLIKKLRAKKNARMLEKFLNQQADDQLLSARPDVQDELAAIKEKLNRAIGILKKSRIARGKRGAEALYVLPWYMIIGPSASGKSTAIRNSGMHFPPVDPDAEDPGKVKGLGGTRNCDWWFTNEGIILDTAGRYTLSPNVQEDREEWSNFLKMLQKVRPRAPINGLILAVSTDELLHQDADGLEAHARAMRSRIDELIVKLEVLFPIYIVFTKCDLIAGFVEFFGDFTKGEREQVWGWTRKYELPRRPLGEEFVQEFGLLAGVLENRRSRQLAGEMRPAQKRGSYLFSVEFAAAGRKLASFVEALLQPNPYQQNPLVRGFYFSSGTQEGTPIAQVMESMQRDFGLVSDFSAQFEPVKETKAYFIKDLFQEIILPDEAKVYPTTKAARRRRSLRVAAMIAQVVLTGLLMLALGNSYLNNRSNNEDLAQTIKRIADETKNQYQPSVAVLNTLDELRDKLERAMDVPLSRRWGLYSGKEVIDRGRVVYFQRYHDILLEPSAQALATDLRGSLPSDASDAVVDDYSSTFDAYRMLTMPYAQIPKSGGGALKKRISAEWRPRINPDSVAQFDGLLDAQVADYWRFRPDSTIMPLRASFNQGVYNYALEQTRKHKTLYSLYRSMINTINDDLGNFDYSEAAPGQARLTGGAGGNIGKAFTREGWEKRVAPEIKETPKVIESDVENKRIYTDPPDVIIQKLREYYVDDFIRLWSGFISAGTIVPFRGLDDAKSGMEDFAQDGSPILNVLTKVYDQSNLDGLDDKSKKKIKDEFTPLGRFLGPEAKKEDQLGKKSYVGFLGTVPGKLKDIKGKLEGGARCAKELQGFNSDLDDIAGNIRRLLLGSGIAKSSVDLLTKPIQCAINSAGGGACECLDHQWGAQVYDAYQKTLATSYPFSKSGGADAPISNLEQFFSTFAGFVTNEINVPGAPSGSGSFQSSVRAANSIEQILARNPSKLQFNLTAKADDMQGIKILRFEYSNDAPFEYVWGSPRTRSYKWPQPGGGACKLQIISRDDVLYTPKICDGDWGFFKLIDQAEKSGNRLTWTFQSSTGGQSKKVVLTLEGPDALFILSGHFGQFQCPQVVCR